MHGIKQKGCGLLTCCLSTVAGVSRSEELWTACLGRELRRGNAGGDAGMCSGKGFGAGECEQFPSPASSLPRMVALGLISNYR